ncbi:response regulator [Tepidamorphus sp. 3E244]|uniref:response regulator n=1 Tax=Tepidamorphus sp. 3E244 TaxID=3385498 RepID=UPI0038FD3A37
MDVDALQNTNPKLHLRRILVAEPSSWDRRQLSSMMRSFGATEIQNVGDGFEALETLDHSGADIALIGENLPGLTGRELVKAIRQHQRPDVCRMPIIFIVNHVCRRDMQEIARLGVHEVVCKPFSTRTLMDRVNWALTIPRPFINIDGYFGPEPRSTFWKHAVKPRQDKKLKSLSIKTGEARGGKQQKPGKRETPAKQAEDNDIVEL